MTSMYTPAGRSSAFHEFTLVARVADPIGLVNSGTVQSVREHVLDHAELTDLVAEAIAESQRVQGAHGHTLWGDAAEAATLILRHVAEVCGVEPEQSDSESNFSENGGVSADYV